MLFLVVGLRFSGFTLVRLCLIIFSVSNAVLMLYFLPILLIFSDMPFTYGSIEVIVSIGSLFYNCGGSIVIFFFLAISSIFLGYSCFLRISMMLLNSSLRSSVFENVLDGLSYVLLVTLNLLRLWLDPKSRYWLVGSLQWCKRALFRTWTKTSRRFFYFPCEFH